LSINERRKSAPRVKFERPLDARAMAIDGTCCRECRLIDVSETGARIEMTSPAAGLTEFFLLLTTFGNPVFRRCTRSWVDGVLMGVTFQKDPIGEKSLKELRREAELV
jgi:PilZ domain-containing protein